MRIAMLISGGGTTATAIFNACKTGRLTKVEPVLVIASNVDTLGIQKILQAGLAKKDVLVIDPKDYLNAQDFGQAIITACQERGVKFIGQYGWLCKTPKNVIDAYPKMMVNQHPGPLDIGRPDFGGKGMFGKRVHAARLEFVRRTNRDFWSEATAQRVAANFDEGAVLKRKQVPINKTDTPDDLAARMLPIEHEVQIETLQDFADNNVKELQRDDPLVLPGEEKILEECKKLAIKMYPIG